MTDSELKDARDEYFEQYRKTAETLTQIKNKIDHETEQYQALMNDLNDAASEYHHQVMAMRRIVTVMIETGCDPVEAKLKIDSDFKSNLWNSREPNLGAIGALGAITATTGYAGANGPAGSINVSSASIAAHASSKLRI